MWEQVFLFVVYIQDNVKQLQDIQNSLVGVFEVIKPGRVSKYFFCVLKFGDDWLNHHSE